ncbi:5-formyltetrahydrofolate cyclo-ligase [Pseudorhizobium flavum]|uniref:5-formyltetrahydrofolate cyclo-ligase n=1 Tax=Pseudorhizobium flavum TaxID=1335061 RepID=UPI00377005E7
MLPKDNKNRSTSPVCYLDEVDSSYSGIEPLSASEAVMSWRKKERRRLIDQRMATSFTTRSSRTDAIEQNLKRLLGDVRDKVISLYWPFRGEPDLRQSRTWIEKLGGRCSLPVVVMPSAPLVFRSWTSDTTLRKSAWGLVEPEASEKLNPDLILAPFVGMDQDGYRLGYGGGYFDRTLVELKKPAVVVGIGFEEQIIPTIYPQPHDVPMDWVLTETGVSKSPTQRFSGNLEEPG